MGNRKKPAEKKKSNFWRKSNFVVDEAEECNIESDEETRAERKSYSERQQARDNKVLALVSKFKKTNPLFQKLVKDKCDTPDCEKSKTRYYEDGLCGTCRKIKRDKAERKRKGELKAKQKLYDQKLKEIQETALHIKQRQKIDKDLQDIDDALGPPDSDSGQSSDDEN